MKITLLSCTPDAANLLLFTKSTRLSMTPNLMDEIRAWPEPKRKAELAYMANTIPSSWEFVDYVFLIEHVSRAYTHQQVRTRAGSYAQQTMRVLDLSAGYDYVMTDANKKSARAVELIERHTAFTQATYASLVLDGQAPEDARGVLPTNIATNIVCKFNLRTMAELSASRTGGRTQGEYRDVCNQMCDAVLDVHPWADAFLFQKGRDHFADLESFAMETWPDDLMKRGALLKIVDKMRKEKS